MCPTVTPRFHAGILLVMLLNCLAWANETISHSVAGNSETWRIDQPVVTQRLTEYHQIRFVPGDTITITAAGCVQTGGSGATWKLYVTPQGPNSDHLYHGLIEIPSVTPPGRLDRIAGWVNRPLKIPQGFPEDQLYLRLGYEDDDYSDNGYWGHDDGTGNQCRNVGPAWVSLTVTHTISPPQPTPTPVPSAAPFDLAMSIWDDNALPKNSPWSYQLNHADIPNPDSLCFPLVNAFLNPNCSTQNPTLDVASGFHDAVCGAGASHPLHGHVNWIPATYEGRLYWDDHSGGLTGDDDYNFLLVPPNAAGLTTGNGHVAGNGPPAFGVEFDSDETIDHFTTPWWSSFHNAVDNDDAQAHQMVDGKDAILISLLGLDCEHSCPAELHPVFGFALHVKDDPNDDTWAIFLRNWGDEGYCSDNQHYVDLSTMAFRLPWRPGANAVTVLNKPDDSDHLFLTNDSRVNGPNVQWAVNQGVLVGFGMPSPDSQARLNGELHLKWNVTDAAMFRDFHRLVAPPIRHVGTGQPLAQVEEVDRRLKRLEEQLTPQQRQVLKAATARTPVEDRAVPQRTMTQNKVERLPVPQKPRQLVRTRTVRDVRKVEKDTARDRALCQVFNNNIPGVPAAACREVAPR